MIQALLTLVAALPKLITLVQRLEGLFGPKWDDRLQRGLDGYEALERAKTSDERAKAEKELSKVWLGDSRP